MKSYHFAVFAPSAVVLWSADVAVGNSEADRRRAAAARAAAAPEKLFFKKRDSEVTEFRAKILENSPEIPHFRLSVAHFLRILKGAANVEDVENLSPGAYLRGLEMQVQSRQMSPSERDRIVQNFNHCKFIQFNRK